MRLRQCYDNALRLTGYAATSRVVPGGYAETVSMYSQVLGYDAFGNLTSRETDVWGDEGGFSAAYANGRKLNGDEIYDNAGNLVSNPIATNTYDGWAFDASGRNVRTVMAWDESLQRRKDTISNLLDGDGRAVKRVDLKETWVRSAPPAYVSSTKTEYYIRSSVLGGKVLTELREDGTKKQTNVYTGEAVIAEQMSFPADGQHQAEWGYVVWKHEDPVTGSYSRKHADGSSPTGSEPLPNAELEPLGGRIPDEDPYDPTIPPPAGLRDFRYNGGDVFRPEYGCIVDGFVQQGPGLCTKMLDNGSGRLNSNYDLLPAVASAFYIYPVTRAIGDNGAPPPPGSDPDSIYTSASYATTRYEYDYIFGGGSYTLGSIHEGTNGIESPSGQTQSCTFNINLNVLDKTLSEKQLAMIKAAMQETFAAAGHKLVFNDPTAASETEKGSYNLTIEQRLSGDPSAERENVAQENKYRSNPTFRFNAMLTLGYTENSFFGGIQNRGYVATYWTKYSMFGRVQNHTTDDAVARSIAAVGVHEAAHYFLRKILGNFQGVHSKNRNNIMSDGNKLDQSILTGELGFSSEQRAALAKWCAAK
ncbi:MAG: hypothetical protein IT174_08895 [Acidobacteria bacterium]|nr:hypothetical protein [Acidobacteriota bacterium]